MLPTETNKRIIKNAVTVKKKKARDTLLINDEELQTSLEFLL